MSEQLPPQLPRLRKARRIVGRHLALRDADVRDAAFIHGLRTDPARARHLSAVPPDPRAQVEWLQHYAQDNAQAYFIVLNAIGGEPFGDGPSDAAVVRPIMRISPRVTCASPLIWLVASVELSCAPR